MEDVATIYIWKGPLNVWLQLQQSVNDVHYTKTFTTFAVHCLSKCEQGLVATLKLILLSPQ